MKQSRVLDTSFDIAFSYLLNQLQTVSNMRESKIPILRSTLLFVCREYKSDCILSNYSLRILWNCVVIEQEKAKYASVCIAAPYFIASIHQAVSWKSFKFVAWIFTEAVKSYWNFGLWYKRKTQLEGYLWYSQLDKEFLNIFRWNFNGLYTIHIVTCGSEFLIFKFRCFVRLYLLYIPVMKLNNFGIFYVLTNKY